MVYEVEFRDGQFKDYAANVITENIITQVDFDGLSITMLGAITDWQRDESAVEKVDKYLVTQCGQRRSRKTTQGWKLQVLWKDRSMAWIPPKDLKESHPVEVAKVAKV
eukprot:2799777-Ditylum_brightwellii.AAC.1